MTNWAQGGFYTRLKKKALKKLVCKSAVQEESQLATKDTIWYLCIQHK